MPYTRENIKVLFLILYFESLNFNPDLTQEEESLILSGEMIALALEKDHYELSLDIRVYIYYIS